MTYCPSTISIAAFCTSYFKFKREKGLAIMLCLAIMICFGKTAYAETGVDGFIFPSPEEQLNEMEEQGYSDEEIAIAQIQHGL